MQDDADRTRTYHVGQHDAALVRLDGQTFREMVEHSPDLISLHDPGGVYQYASPACYTLLGYRPFELEGHNAYEFFHADDLTAIQESHDSIVDRVEAQTVRYRIRNFHGEYVWFETTSRTIRNPYTGEPERIIAVSRRANRPPDGRANVVVISLVDEEPEPVAKRRASRRARRGQGTQVGT